MFSIKVISASAPIPSQGGLLLPLLEIMFIIFNKGQSNLAKGNISRLLMSYAKEILPILFIIFARWQHALQSWSRWVQLHLHSSFWERGGRRGSVMVPLERLMVVSYRVSVVTIALSLTIRLKFAIECLRCSKEQSMDQFGEEGVDSCKLNFNAIWKRHGAVVCKRNCVDIFCNLSTMYECDI